MNDDKGLLAFGADHAGYLLKNELIEALSAEGFRIQDFGTFSGEGCDYPDIAKVVGEAVASGKFARGVLICGTGIGMIIAANKIKGIRAGACSEPYSAKLIRMHNNANILGIGARIVAGGLALEIVKAFLETDFEGGGRHERRVAKIRALDEIDN